jgi:hypothetical protein
LQIIASLKWIYKYLYIYAISAYHHESCESNPAQARCTRYNIMWYNLSVTSGRSVVFFWYSGFLHQ